MKVNQPKQKPKNVVVSHSQCLRQSHNYQSMEVSYGVQLPCTDDEDDIKRTMKQAADLVEDGLAHKIQQQRKLLGALGDKRGENEGE
jgi:hypothetical protein